MQPWIKIRAQASGTTDIGQNGAEFNHKLQVIDKWTDSNCEAARSDTSPYVLGKYADPVSVKIATYGNDDDKGDVLLKGRYNGNFTKKKFVYEQVSVSVGLDLKIASIDWSHPLCCSSNIIEDTEYIFDQTPPNEWTKIAEYSYKDRYLPNEGMYFQAIVQNA